MVAPVTSSVSPYQSACVTSCLSFLVFPTKAHLHHARPIDAVTVLREQHAALGASLPLALEMLARRTWAQHSGRPPASVRTVFGTALSLLKTDVSCVSLAALMGFDAEAHAALAVSGE